jgi:hypothetical protein
MVNNISMRDRLVESTQGIWGQLNKVSGSDIRTIFGRIQGKSTGSSNYYDVEAFYSTVNVNRGEKYKYVYNQFKSEIKPRKFIRYTAGVKVTEEQMVMDNDSLRAMVDNAATKQERGLRSSMEQDLVGHLTEQSLVSAMNSQGTANSSIIDPADCNSTPGTPAALGAVNLTGAGKTERNLEAVVGFMIQAIGSKVLDTTTGESILHNDGSDTYDLWVHPSVALILDTNADLLDADAHDTMTYTQRLAAMKVTVRPSMAIASWNGAIDGTTVVVLTANTAENFKYVDVEAPTWMAWKDIDNGEVIEFVKRFKAGAGAVATPYISGTQAYKAMASATITPIGA